MMFRANSWQGYTQPYGGAYVRWMIFNVAGNIGWAPYVMMIRGGNYQYNHNYQIAIRQVKRLGI
jgi:hypothetical protein